MTDLFSSFNPNRVIFFEFCFNWVSTCRIILFFPRTYWILKRKKIKLIQIVINFLLNELKAVLGTLTSPGVLIYFSRILIIILLNNFLGLFPYVFTSTRHLSCTLSLALPLWIGYILIRIKTQIEHNLAHLVPEGTPVMLIPLIVLIETTRLIIRPGTLAVRLAANIVAGHLLITLLGSQGSNLSIIILLFLIFSIVLLIILECAVACIQSYVFTILSTLYLNEHSSKIIFS